MNRKDIIFLLLPTALFAAMAGLSFFYASALLPEPQHTQRTQHNIDEVMRKAQSGEFGPNSDRLIDLLKDSWRGRDLLHESLARSHAISSKSIGYGVLLGVVAQIYVVFRVKARLKNKRSA